MEATGVTQRLMHRIFQNWKDVLEHMKGKEKRQEVAFFVNVFENEESVEELPGWF